VSALGFALEHAADAAAIVHVGPTKRASITYANAAFCAMVGCEAAHLIGRDPDDVMGCGPETFVLQLDARHRLVSTREIVEVPRMARVASRSDNASSRMGAPVFFFEMMSKDAPAARTFYRDAFGWTIGDRAPGAEGVDDYTIVTPHEKAGIAGGIGAAPPGYEGHATIYISVPDVATALAVVETLGGSRIFGPSQVPGGPVIGLFRDPTGLTVGLVEVPESARATA
jgi:predicted enzyme related to lactoylglutathione lyase